MIDTPASTIHTIKLTSAQVNVIVEALSEHARHLRADGPTPELNELIDNLDAFINDDFAED